MRIYLIRHGETTANIEQKYCSSGGSPLTEKGWNQVNRLVMDFPTDKLNYIYSSPLDRCSSLAEKLASKYSLEPLYDDRIKEYDFGIFDNLSWKEAKSQYPEEFKSFCDDPVTFQIPGGDSQVIFNKRVSKFINNLPYGSDNIAIVTHAGVIRSVLAHLLNLGIKQRWIFKIGNGSVTIIEVSKEGAFLILGGCNDY